MEIGALKSVYRAIDWIILSFQLTFYSDFVILLFFHLNQMSDKLTRIAIVEPDRCKPKKCRQECKKSCPVVRMGIFSLI